MDLNLTSLEKAIKSLEESTDIYMQLEDTAQPQLINVLRAGVIQNFEFTYELCWKFMKRWINLNDSAADVLGITRRELFRLAIANNLISDIDKWLSFHQSRNLTSHTYNTEIAADVFNTALEFLPFAQYLFERLKERN